MEEKIQVRMLEDGRALAKIEPLGPVVIAESAGIAVEFVKRAHQAYVRQQRRWLPPGMTIEAVRYQVVSAP